MKMTPIVLKFRNLKTHSKVFTFCWMMCHIYSSLMISFHIHSYLQQSQILQLYKWVQRKYIALVPKQDAKRWEYSPAARTFPPEDTNSSSFSFRSVEQPDTPVNTSTQQSVIQSAGWREINSSNVYTAWELQKWADKDGFGFQLKVPAKTFLCRKNVAILYLQ